MYICSFNLLLKYYSSRYYASDLLMLDLQKLDVLDRQKKKKDDVKIDRRCVQCRVDLMTDNNTS